MVAAVAITEIKAGVAIVTTPRLPPLAASQPRIKSVAAALPSTATTKACQLRKPHSRATSPIKSDKGKKRNATWRVRFSISPIIITPLAA